jgi:hypothetical protein
MRLLNILLALALAVFASAFPLKRENGKVPVIKSGSDPKGRGKDRTFTDIDVLQYLLFVEHTENALYNLAMSNYTKEDFQNAGYSADIYGRYQQLVSNEKAHLDAITNAIVAAGVEPIPVCDYHFPFTTLDQFLQTTHSLEQVHAASRSGAAFLIEDTNLAALVGSIYGTEARQAAWISSAVFNQNPWNTPFETHIDFREVNTLGKSLIVSCPQNMPFVPGVSDGDFGTLGVTLDLANSSAVFEFDRPTGALAGQPLYAAFMQGNMTAFVPIDDASGRVTVPYGLRGFVFGLVTTDKLVLDNVTVAGPVALQFPFNSEAQLIIETH